MKTKIRTAIDSRQCLLPRQRRWPRKGQALGRSASRSATAERNVLGGRLPSIIASHHTIARAQATNKQTNKPQRRAEGKRFA
eukprot:6204312-Pleurochrysis_carterae.AAC.1